MSRYIDADALIADIKNRYCHPQDCNNYHGIKCRACAVDDCIQDVDEYADNHGIDIVRCKECYMCDDEMWCSFYDSIMESDDFCSYGERREP